MYLILDQELDTLNGSSGGLRDGGRDTTHCYHESVSSTFNMRQKSHQSIDISDSDNSQHALVEEDILKKSITKGGLLRKSLA